MTNAAAIYELYKPLRNYVRKLSLRESCYVIWAYAEYLHFSKSIPKDIQVSLEFQSTKHWAEKNIYLWDLELLLREIIIHGDYSEHGKYSLRKWDNFATAINKIKNLTEGIGEVYINEKNILIELFRVAHRQFPWQSRPNNKLVTRYYKIFKDPGINSVVESEIGISVKRLYLIGMALMGMLINSHVVKYPLGVSTAAFTKEDVEIFISRFASEIDSLRDKLKEETEFNDKYAYSYSSLRAYPLIKIKSENAIICPFNTLLIWRITSGLYYEICSIPEFANHYGRSFQRYAGDVLERTSATGKIRIVPESEYIVGRERKMTVDWIAIDSSEKAALFIECKTKRMVIPAKIELNNEKVVDAELIKMAEFICQIYKSINDYLTNYYENVKYDPEMAIFPMVLTLENWYLFGDKLMKRLDDFVEKEVSRRGLSQDVLKIMPYSICSAEDYEELMQVVQYVGIGNYMKAKHSDEFRTWGMREYSRKKYADEVKKTKFLFDEDFQTIFSEVMPSSNE